MLNSYNKENKPYYWRKISLLHIAVVYGTHEIVQYLLDFGYDPDERNENGSTPLMFACENRKIKKALQK